MKAKKTKLILSLFLALLPLRQEQARGADPESTVKNLYVFSATHFDLFFTGPPPSSFARNHRIFDAALGLAEEQPDFRYIIENLYLLDQYLQTHPEKRAPFASAIRQGKIELAAQWADMLQNLVTGEDLVRNILTAREFARRDLQFTPSVQTLSDVPGQTPQAPQILSGSGVRGLVISRAGPSEPHLFRWKGLEGSQIQVASLPLGYAGGYFLGISESLEAMEGTKLAEFELSDISPDILVSRIKQPAGLKDSVRSSYRQPLDRGLAEVAWDNSMPPSEVSRNIAAWNQKYEDQLRLIPVLPGIFFREHFPSEVPVLAGEIPSVWGGGYGSVIGGYTPHIRTSHLLLRAEKWASLAEILLNKPYPVDRLRNGWEEHLITLDHEGDALRWQREHSESVSGKVLEESQQAIASHVHIPQRMDIALVVFNSLNWPRSQTVTTTVHLVGDPFAFFTRPFHKLQLLDFRGNPVSFEIVNVQSTIIRSIQIRFRAEDIPPLGWKAYYLRPVETAGEISFPKAEAAPHEADIQNKFYRVQFHGSTGFASILDKATRSVVRLLYYHQPVETTPGTGFFREKDSGKPVPPRWKRVARGVNLGGPYLEIEGDVSGAELKLSIQLDGDYPVAVSETVRWLGGKRIKLVRQLDFPKGGRFVYGVPYGTQEIGNLMPNAGPPKDGSFDELPRDFWLWNREFDGWAAWRKDQQQIAMASEARGGAFDGRSLKISLLNTAEALPPDMTNHPVPNEFVTRFSLGFSPQPEAAARTSWELYSPLETMVSVGYQSGTLPNHFAVTESADRLFLTTMKKAEDQKGWILRGYAGETGANWPALLLKQKAVLRRANLMEVVEPASSAEPVTRLRPFEIRTLRIELAD
jgi:hypothetical protein